jgi:hypothetical protein
VVIDPRNTYRPSKRDLSAGAWIGKGYEVAQYQLHEAVFAGRTLGWERMLLNLEVAVARYQAS